jgi:hypothetical protein
MLDNLNLSRKLIGGFVLVAIIGMGVGLFAIREMNRIAEADSALYEKPPFRWD